MNSSSMEYYPELLLPTAYFPPVSYFAYLIQSSAAKIEQWETYPKQTYRNRCEIMTSAGKMNLVVPVIKTNGNNTMTRDIGICYREPWQSHHWKSIMTAYRSSPFFNYYADIFHPLFNLKESSLIRLNEKTRAAILQITGIKVELQLTSNFVRNPDACSDLRSIMKPTHEHETMIPSYPQVFSHLHGFMNNLSILDLIFNMGPESKDYLLALELQHAYKAPGGRTDE